MKLLAYVAIPVALLLFVGACGDDEPVLSLPTPTQEAAELETPSIPCVPAPQGEIVTIELFADGPVPQCSQMRESQQMRVVNSTEEDVRVTLGDLNVVVAAGDEWLFNVPIGAYLALGVHTIEAFPLAAGPQLWVVEE